LNRNPKIRDYISERVEGMSFEEIYSKYVDAVYRFLKFKLGDEHLVEDVLQETFLAVYENLQKIKDRGPCRFAGTGSGENHRRHTKPWQSHCRAGHPLYP
jgi:hypothetical protein